MTYKTENQIKMVLGLNAWRNLLQDKVVRFSHMMLEMEPGVMMKLMGELPQLRDFARETLQRLDRVTNLAVNNAGLAAAHQQIEHTWHQDSQFMRKLIALDYVDTDDKDSSKEKTALLESMLQQLKECQDLLRFEEQFLRQLCKRNQDSLRHFIIAMLVYTGGCFYLEADPL